MLWFVGLEDSLLNCFGSNKGSILIFYLLFFKKAHFRSRKLLVAFFNAFSIVERNGMVLASAAFKKKLNHSLIFVNLAPKSLFNYLKLEPIFPYHLCRRSLFRKDSAEGKVFLSA
jgi:hypothetical protein